MKTREAFSAPGEMPEERLQMGIYKHPRHFP